MVSFFSCSGTPVPAADTGAAIADQSLGESDTTPDVVAVFEPPPPLPQNDPVPQEEPIVVPEQLVAEQTDRMPEVLSPDPDSLASELPQINLPPEPRDEIVYVPVLPEPPPFEFPFPEKPLMAMEPEVSPEPDIALAEPDVIEPVPPETGMVIFPPETDQEPLAEADVAPFEESRPPPEPPLFLRLPEREIVSAPREAPPAERPRAENRLPDAPVSRQNPEDGPVVFSRIIRATAGQLIEIPFRGANWVYEGEIASRRGIAFESRRPDPEGQTFVLRTEIPGEFIVKFNRQDLLRDYSITDYVQIIVEEPGGTFDNAPGRASPPTDQMRVTAERWPLIDNPNALASQPSAVPSASAPSSALVQPSEAAVENLTDDFPQTDTGSSPSITPSIPIMGPDDYITQAKNQFDAGNILSALSLLEEMERLYPGMDDEALWLLAQLLEANSPNRDVRQALEYYRRLVQEFPQSLRIPEAQQRIAYLQRFFFNIQ